MDCQFPHYYFPHFSFHADLVLRLPVFPLNTQFDLAFLKEGLTNPVFKEALYLASPDLHDEYIKWLDDSLSDDKKDARLLNTITKYYSRSFSRCTPFGLFAGCAVVSWADTTNIRLDAAFPSRHTRLDMQYLCSLAGKLATSDSVKEEIRYFPNSSLYSVGDEIRYIEYRDVDGDRLHQISSADATEPLRQVLTRCKKGASVPELAAHLAAPDVPPQEALEFIEQLIDAQVIVHELEPAVTGQEFLEQILEVLTRIEHLPNREAVKKTVQTLLQVKTDLKGLDDLALGNTAPYQNVMQLLEALGVPFEKNRLFQADLSVNLTRNHLTKTLQNELRGALEALLYLSPNRENERLENFKKKFFDRYESKEMPLLEVLDTELGISYGGEVQDNSSSLTQDLVFSSPDAAKEQVIRRGEAEQFMYEKLRAAEKEGSYSIAVTPEELSEFKPVSEVFSPSLSVVFRLVDSDRIVLENVGGSSAANLLGRFAHLDDDIHRIVRQITTSEQQKNPDVIFAEIAHLPAARPGNILLRPAFRRYEIPYLAKSVLPEEAQIALQDLFVSVRNGRLVLRSQKLDKIIIPRLSSAHNFTLNSMPVYHFLCDLQTQGLCSGLGFQWSSVAPGAKFQPRLTCRNVVLHLATWQLQREDLRELLDKEGDQEFPAVLADFRRFWRLPRYFTLADHDNELLVDVDNPLMVKAWLATIKTRDKVLLKEFLFESSKSVVTDAQGQPYVNQFITSLICIHPSYNEENNGFQKEEPVVQRDFWLGSEWLYYKFYCGINTSDRILLAVIKPLTEELMADNLIDQWFFIRYLDPDNHLRVRFHLPDEQHIGLVVQRINQYLHDYLQAGFIWKSQTDTYRRELERYGEHSMALSEELFFHDSVAALAIIEYTRCTSGEDLRWMWVIRSADDLLNAFEYALPEKQALILGLKTAFAEEFSVDKQLKLQLDSKYRNHKAGITHMLSPGAGITDEEGYPAKALCVRNRLIGKIARDLAGLKGGKLSSVSADELLKSYIHMAINRLIPANQRLHEMIIYDFLHRQYQSQVACLNKKPRQK